MQTVPARILEAASNVIRARKKMSRLRDSRQVRSLSLPCVKTAIPFSRRHCSDIDPNVEITLLDVFGTF
jgi:hypothetical protein